MEHSTSGGTWHPVNRSKAPRELIRNSLGHIARGSDGALFFQWRSSRSGAEQYFSGMVPHAGTDSKIWRETKELGGILRKLEKVAGSRVEAARVAILFDDEAGWVSTRGLKPRHNLNYGAEARKWHRALWEKNILADVVGPWADPSPRRRTRPIGQRRDRNRVDGTHVSGPVRHRPRESMQRRRFGSAGSIPRPAELVADLLGHGVVEGVENRQRLPPRIDRSRQVAARGLGVGHS